MYIGNNAKWKRESQNDYRKETIFSLPEVQNWIKNVKLGADDPHNPDKYFWDDALYHFTKIYDSLKPFQRVCMDLRVEGKMPAEIAEIVGREDYIIHMTLNRLKNRFMKVIK